MASKDWVSAEKQDKNSDQIEELIPKLRFNNFHENWQLIDFMDVFNSLPTKKYQIKSKDIKEKGKFIVVDQGKEEIAGYFDDKTKLFNDLPIIIYGDHTTIVKFKDEPFIVGADGVKLLNSKINANLKYLYYALLNVNIKPEGYKRHFSILKKVKIPISNINEQTKIANFLSLVDKKIELMEKTLVLYERYKKQLQNEIFNKKLIKNELKAIKLKDICTIKKGKQLNKSDMVETGEYYVLNGGKNPSGFTNSWNVNENTITISEGGNSCGYVSFNTEKFYCGGHCYYLNITSDVDNYYLFNYLKFIELKIMRLRVGSGLPNIQKGDIENLLIKLPSIKIQEEIGLFFKFINNYILLKENEKEKMINFKKALLQQMFI